MKKKIVTLLIAMVLVFTVVPSVFAANGHLPVGSCPPGLEIMDFMHHDDGDMDHHIGLKVDLNGDGLICMKVLPNGLHVHMDNVIQ